MHSFRESPQSYDYGRSGQRPETTLYSRQFRKIQKKSTPQEHTFYEREYTKYAYYFPQTYYCIKRK